MKTTKMSVLRVAILVLLGSACAVASAANKNTNMASGRNTIVQLFEWRWVDIATECETFLGPNGFGGLQVSPPAENVIIENPSYNPVVYRPWFEIYQPVSYKVNNRDGTEAQFQDMVNRCNAVNVRVYVDAVFNQMTANDAGSGTGTGGSAYDASTESYSGVPYTSANFHACADCPSADCQIDNYNDATQVRNCQLSGLLDLNQANADTQSKMIEYLNRLSSYGVAGFRVDAAKHMWPADLTAIYDQLDDLPTVYFSAGTKPYIYQEVIDMGGEAVKYSEYTGLGDVTEFKYGYNLAYVFRKENPMAFLENWGEGWGMMSSDDALVFIDNHDTQRGSGPAGEDVLTFFDARMYKMANAFMLAHPYGQTRVMSSYYWTRDIVGGSDQNSWYGPPHDANYNISPITCDYYTWVCEHRWREIYNMIKFRNTVDGTDLENWWSGSDYTIAFSRGNKGFLAINDETTDMDVNLYTGLPAGTYCDLISGDLAGGACTGSSVTVDGSGNAQIFISSTWEDPIVAISVDAKLN